jgi:hypothetical protein
MADNLSKQIQDFLSKMIEEICFPTKPKVVTAKGQPRDEIRADI